MSIPKPGLGAWGIEDAAVAQVIGDAVRIGYRHVDTAQAGANERGVGEGLRASGAPRSDLFVATKLAAEWNDDLTRLVCRKPELRSPLRPPARHE